MQNKTTLVALVVALLTTAASSAQACAPSPAHECGARSGDPLWVGGRLMRISGINADPDLPGIDGVRIQLQSLVDDATADAVAVVLCGEFRGEPVCLLAPENFNLKGN